MPKRRTRDEMAAYQRERRSRVTPGVTPAVTPARVGPDPVTPARQLQTPSDPVTPAVSTRQALRDRLAALEAQYRAAQRAQDWPACRRVNDEREPLFGELWELERELPESERYWFPARIINQGEGFAVGRVR